MANAQKMQTSLLCWDSSIFIDWIKGASDFGNGMQFISDVVAEVKAERIMLLASTLVYPEILDNSAKMPAGASGKIEKFMKNGRYVAIADVTSPVAKKAQQIRNTLLGKNIKLKTPDAIHIATAIVHAADYLHTFDRQMINLSKRPEVDGLIIAGEIPRIPRSVFKPSP